MRDLFISEVDDIAPGPGDPPGWHVRDTLDGVPLMGSSPAERAEAVERRDRIRREAMRDHPFAGDGPYCEARVSFAPMGGPETGVITGWAGCGYPRQAHPQVPPAPVTPSDHANDLARSIERHLGGLS